MKMTHKRPIVSECVLTIFPTSHALSWHSCIALLGCFPTTKQGESFLFHRKPDTDRYPSLRRRRGSKRLFVLCRRAYSISEIMLSSDTLARAKAWMAKDPNPTTVDYVQNLIDKGDDQQLDALFPPTRLQFGTAGLRSRMQPGPVGMNELVVLQTAQGLVKYIQNEYNNTSSANKKNICAVIGYDHRSSGPGDTFHVSSLSFAIFTALVFMEAGIHCLLLDGFVATPLVPFGLSRFVPEIMFPNDKETVAFGVMITASHNPAQDAGYKVYWTDGCQIRNPTDQGIAQSIEQNLEPWADYQKIYSDRKATYPNDPCLGLSKPHETNQLVQEYFHAIRQSGLVTGQAKLATSPSAPKFCYTAMHGIGHQFAKQSFSNFGLAPFFSVPQQEKPDPTFPTVAFPNPEEKGALDLAKECALQNGCKVILANDPDADRLAVTEYSENTWVDLTGDQIGVLLGHWLWTQFKDNSAGPDGSPLPVSMCCSTVSSQMLSTMAKKEGFHVEDTLTGFKWIGSRAAELAKSGKYQQVFCYEEAIGYCCGNVIFDKDGVTACAVFAEMTLYIYETLGMTLVQYIQSLYERYGEFVSNNGYYILHDSSVVPEIMRNITEDGTFARSHVGDYEISAIRYLGEPGYDSSTSDKKPTLPTSASSPMVTIRFTNGGVAQFRASGTEPKFKYYMELAGAPGLDRKTVEADCRAWSLKILADLIQPAKYGLKDPADSPK